MEDLKKQVRILTEELAKANETISFLTSVTGQNPDIIKRNLGNLDPSFDQSAEGGLKRQDSALTLKGKEGPKDNESLKPSAQVYRQG